MSDVVRVDIDAIMAEVRQRVRRKREMGIYTPEVETLLRSPLPGGAPQFVPEETTDPLEVLPDYLGVDISYDPRSRRAIIGPIVTFVRRSLIWLLRWWVYEGFARQDRVNRLIIRKLELLDQLSPAELHDRVKRIEDTWRRREAAEIPTDIDPMLFAMRFGGDESIIRAQAEQFVPLFRGCRRVLDLGCGRGTFLQLMKDEGILAYGVDLDSQMAAACKARGLEVYQVDAGEHLRQLPADSIDGVFAAHFAEHIGAGELMDILRNCKRALRPGSALVLATPNPSTLDVGAHTFWLDPSHRRPLPPDLLQFFVLVAGFVDVEIRTYAPHETHLVDEVPDGPMLENVRLLNRTLFGDRDYAVIARSPS